MSEIVRKKLWIDTDAGVDDAQAILMALSYSDQVDVIGISTVHGNASAHQVALNVLRLLKVAGRLDVRIIFLIISSSIITTPSLLPKYSQTFCLSQQEYCKSPAYTQLWQMVIVKFLSIFSICVVLYSYINIT